VQVLPIAPGHLKRGQSHMMIIYTEAKSVGKWPPLGLESISRGVWFCVAQHVENAVQSCAELQWRPRLM
jgi:hypothetical protein